MIRVTINNYQYWWNDLTRKLYEDKEAKTEVVLTTLTAQEKRQLNNELDKKSLCQLKQKN